MSDQTSIISGFIDLYRQLPALWKIKSKVYSNRKEKSKAYDVLVAYLKNTNKEANVDAVKKKINNIRSAFRKEHKKVLKSKRSGKGTDEIYEPTLWYYKLLLFTASQEEPRTTVSTDNISSDEDQNEDEIMSNNDEGNTEEYVDDDFVQSPPTISADEYTQSSSSTITSTPKVKKINKQQQAIEQALASVKEDECDVVGCNIAYKLRRMDDNQKLHAEQLINKVLYYGIQNRLSERADVFLSNAPQSQGSFVMQNAPERGELSLPMLNVPQNKSYFIMQNVPERADVSRYTPNTHQNQSSVMQNVLERADASLCIPNVPQNQTSVLMQNDISSNISNSNEINEGTTMGEFLKFRSSLH